MLISTSVVLPTQILQCEKNGNESDKKVSQGSWQKCQVFDHCMIPEKNNIAVFSSTSKIDTGGCD